MNKERTVHIDGNSAWLEIPKSDVMQLDLDAFSMAYAYKDGDALYLSEYNEMPAYLEAAEVAGWQVILRPIISEGKRRVVQELPHLLAPKEADRFSYRHA
jgi:hypothetical protein